MLQHAGGKGAADENIGVKGSNVLSTLSPKLGLNQEYPQSPVCPSAGQRPRYVTLEQALALGDRNDGGTDKNKSSGGPGSVGQNRWLVWVAIGALGLSWACFKKNPEDLNSNGSGENFSGRTIVENDGMGMRKTHAIFMVLCDLISLLAFFGLYKYFDKQKGFNKTRTRNLRISKFCCAFCMFLDARSLLRRLAGGQRGRGHEDARK